MQREHPARETTPRSVVRILLLIGSRYQASSPPLGCVRRHQELGGVYSLKTGGEELPRLAHMTDSAFLPTIWYDGSLVRSIR